MKVLLIMPRLPQRLGAPYLGQQYVAASLMARGCEVRALDLAAVRVSEGDEAAVEAVAAWGPELIGMTLFTYNAARGYRLAKRLGGMARLLVAGGPHPTVCPKEPLEQGFDVSVQGEGEEAIVQIVDVMQGRGALTDIAGLHCGAGVGPPRGMIEDLDALAFPLESYGCFEAHWYSEGAMVVPGGLMTSRGCPARCTFCANYVTGRGFRWRSAGNVVAEMRQLKARHGIRHFAFWDDAFTARRPRLEALCDAIAADPELKGVTWTCITPANMVKPGDLARMRSAGCVGVNFGIESGDAGVLKQIKKGQRPQQVREAVKAASEEGMLTIVNFMFGFPGESVEALETTVEFMEELSIYTDYFNNRGVLVPFPGTDIYDRWHVEHGFTEWWLDPDKVIDEPDLFSMDAHKVLEALERDPTLDLDFFHYSAPVREQIEACVRFKARHNARRVSRYHRPTDDVHRGLG